MTLTLAVVLFWGTGLCVASFEHTALCTLWVQSNATALHRAEVVLELHDTGALMWLDREFGP